AGREAGGRPIADGARASGFQAKQLEDEERVIGALSPVVPESISPLTPWTERLARSCEEGGGAFFTQRLLELEREADPFALERRLALLGERHEILRTALVWDGVGRARAAALPERALQLTYTSLVGFSAGDRDERIREFRRAIPAPDPARDPLFRADVFQAEPGRCLVLLSYLEALFDQHTVGLLAGELLTERPPAGGARPFSGFLALLEGRARSGDAAFWERALKGAREVSSPFVPALGDPDPELERPLTLDFDDQVFRRLKALSRDSRIPFPALAECAFAATLCLHDGARVQLYARAAPVREFLAGALQNTAGNLLALAPARADLAGRRTFLEAAAEIDRWRAEAAPHSFAPPWEIRRAAGGLDFGDVLFLAEDEARLSQGTLSVREAWLPRPRRREADLVFHLEWGERRARVALHASPLRFRRDRLRGFLEAFRGALQTLAASPRLSLAELPLLAPALRDRALAAGRGGGAPAAPPDPGGLGDLLRGHDPGSAALEEGGRAWTRADLALAVAAAARLLAGEAPPEGGPAGPSGGAGGAAPRAAILLPYGPLLAAAALAALRAGFAAVPLDPLLPRERHLFILGDSGAAAVLTGPGLLPYAEALCRAAPAGPRALDIEGELRRALGPGFPAQGGGAAGPAPPAGTADFLDASDALDEAADGTLAAAWRGAPSRLAALLYCGRPSPGAPWTRADLEGGGAAVSAAGIAERIRISREAFALGPGTRALALPGTPAERVFGDLVPALQAGGLVAGLPAPDPAAGLPAPDAVESFAREAAVTFAWLPACVGKLLLGRRDLPGLRTLALSGPSPGTLYPGREGLRTVYAYAWPGFPALWRELPAGPSAGASLPGGSPPAGIEALVLDARGGIAPPGAAGLLCLAGEAVGRPARTLPAGCPDGTGPADGAPPGLFRPHPLPRRGGPAEILRAPDLAVLDEDGLVCVLGPGPRLPRLRGRAFAPEALERRLFAPSFLKTMRAGLWERPGAPAELALWIKAGFRDDDAAEKAGHLLRLRNTLARELPPWLVPTRLALCEILPLENGLPALDRLPAPDPALLPADRGLEGTLAHREAAECVSSAWRALLEGDPDPDATFASAGLDGDLAFLLAKNLRARGFPAEASDPMAFPTPAALAAELCRRLGPEALMPSELPSAAAGAAADALLEGAYLDLGEIGFEPAGEGDWGDAAPPAAALEAPPAGAPDAPPAGVPELSPEAAPEAPPAGAPEVSPEAAPEAPPAGAPEVSPAAALAPDWVGA
ncbi:MAG: condensation domain-containing protein, partial [Deltaproteobacteria bacterium]|nr:condensation domain-containing protein [Deltaproteobacteria bacterium]